MKQPKLSAERARELFSYDPETGSLTWKLRWGRAKPGNPAGHPRKDGYTEVRADGQLLLAHRLVWLISTGDWPKLFIDHKNGDRSDNRLLNLRDVSRTLNQQNLQRARADSATGLLGVSLKRNKVRARIRVEGSERALGVFSTPEEAHGAYLAAKRKYHQGCTL